MSIAIEKDSTATISSKTTALIGAILFGLAASETYAGLAMRPDGTPSHHLVLLPAVAEELTWDQAKEFAADAGGELPTRQEQALLYANLKDQFEGDWYWSSEQHADNSDSAWIQYFVNGYQDLYHESSKCRARAVRRLPI